MKLLAIRCVQSFGNTASRDTILQEWDTTWYMRLDLKHWMLMLIKT